VSTDKTREEIQRQVAVLYRLDMSVASMLCIIRQPGGRKVIALAEELITAIDAHVKRLGQK